MMVFGILQDIIHKQHCFAIGSVNTLLKNSVQVSDLPCIRYFGLPVSVSCPMDRNVNDEDCLPFASA